MLLASLTNEQRAIWSSNQLTTKTMSPLGHALRTREEDDVDLLWVTKIGGPSHGFDVGANCLLPLLANGRTRAGKHDWPNVGAS